LGWIQGFFLGYTNCRYSGLLLAAVISDAPMNEDFDSTSMSRDVTSIDDTFTVRRPEGNSIPSNSISSRNKIIARPQKNDSSHLRTSSSTDRTSPADHQKAIVSEGQSRTRSVTDSRAKPQLKRDASMLKTQEVKQSPVATSSPITSSITSTERGLNAISLKNMTRVGSHPPRYAVSVVRCDRNTEWITAIPNDWGLMVFEKCGETLDERYSVPAKNGEGNEDLSAHMLYIIEHYQNLPNISIFMQDDGISGYQLEGRTCPHTPYHTLGELKEDVDKYLDGFLNIGAVDTYYEYLFAECQHCPHFPFMLEQLLGATTVAEFANQTRPGPMVTYVMGSHWAVTKERILRHPIETYQRIHDYIMWNDGAEARDRACALERLLHVLFGEDIEIPKTKYVRGFRNKTEGCDE
jgi:Protein of unknown function (DUF3431)